MKKRIVYIIQILNIVCTGFITLAGMGALKFLNDETKTSSSFSYSTKGIWIVWIVCGLNVIFAIIGIVSEKKNMCTEKKKKLCERIYNKEEMKKQYLYFLKECSEVNIIVRHLEHLCEDQQQYMKIKELGNKCTILFEKCDNTKIFQQLKENKVVLIQYPAEDKITNIKGQFVKGPQRKCLLIEKKDGEEFHLIKIENTYIQTAIERNIDKIIKQNKNKKIS